MISNFDASINEMQRQLFDKSPRTSRMRTNKVFASKDSPSGYSKLIQIEQDTTLVRQLDATEISLTQLLEKNSLLKNKIKHMQRLLEREREENARSEEVISNSQSQIQQFESKIVELESRSIKFNELLLENELEVEKYRKRCDFLKTEKGSLEKRCSELERALRAVDTSPMRSKQTPQSSESVLETSVELMSLQRLNKQLQNELLGSRDSIVKLTQTIERLTRGKEAVEYERECILLNNLEFKESYADLNSRFQEAILVVEDLQSENLQLQAEVSQLQESLAADRPSDEDSVGTHHWQRKWEERGKEIDDLKQEKKLLVDTLESCSSRSSSIEFLLACKIREAREQDCKEISSLKIEVENLSKLLDQSREQMSNERRAHEQSITKSLEQVSSLQVQLQSVRCEAEERVQDASASRKQLLAQLEAVAESGRECGHQASAHEIELMRALQVSDEKYRQSFGLSVSNGERYLAFLDSVQQEVRVLRQEVHSRQHDSILMARQLHDFCRIIASSRPPSQREDQAVAFSSPLWHCHGQVGDLLTAVQSKVATLRDSDRSTKHNMQAQAVEINALRNRVDELVVKAEIAEVQAKDFQRRLAGSTEEVHLLREQHARSLADFGSDRAQASSRIMLAEERCTTLNQFIIALQAEQSRQVAEVSQSQLVWSEEIRELQSKLSESHKYRMDATAENQDLTLKCRRFQEEIMLLESKLTKQISETRGQEKAALEANTKMKEQKHQYENQIGYLQDALIKYQEQLKEMNFLLNTVRKQKDHMISLLASGDDEHIFALQLGDEDDDVREESRRLPVSVDLHHHLRRPPPPIPRQNQSAACFADSTRPSTSSSFDSLRNFHQALEHIEVDYKGQDFPLTSSYAKSEIANQFSSQRTQVQNMLCEQAEEQYDAIADVAEGCDSAVADAAEGCDSAVADAAEGASDTSKLSCLLNEAELCDGHSVPRESSEHAAEFSHKVHEFKFAERYSIQEQLGKGAFATVFRARVIQSSDFVAVKAISRSHLSKGDEEAIRHEINILGILTDASSADEHIIRFYDFYEEKTTFFVVMELLEGGELFDRLMKKVFYSEKDARDLIAVTLSAIQFCHSRNIVHRDLKPENLLLVNNFEEANIKLIDFGVSGIASDNTLEGYVGSTGYIAPEILDLRLHGKPVDIWSIGVIAFLLLSGSMPFDTSSSMKLRKAVRTKKFSFETKQFENVTAEAKNLISLMLEPDENLRITAEAALKHPWFSIINRTLTEDHQLQGTFVQLQRLNARRKFKVIVKAIIARSKFITLLNQLKSKAPSNGIYSRASSPRAASPRASLSRTNSHLQVASLPSSPTSDNVSTVFKADPIDEKEDHVQPIFFSEASPSYEPSSFPALYEVTAEVLEKGQFGSTFKGIRKFDKELIAVKILERNKLTINDESKVTQEFAILSSLSHENIMKSFDLFEEESTFVLVIELLPPVSLLDRLVTRKYYSENQVRNIIGGLVSAVLHCHGNNIIHRNICPENLRLLPGHDDSYVKLIGFDSAINLDAEDCPSRFAGTLGYAAPETLEGGEYGPAVDLWSIGVVSHLLLSGSLPFDSSSRRKYLQGAKSSEDLTYPSPCWTTISPEAKSFVKLSLHYEPLDRLSVTAAQDHHWMTKRSSELTVRELPTSIAHLRIFNIKKKFKRIAKLLILHSKFMRTTYDAVCIKHLADLPPPKPRTLTRCQTWA